MPLRRCWDLSEAHIKEAIGSRQAMGKLLRDLAGIAKPDSGATKILIALARLAKPSTDWIDGALRVEIEAVEGKTRFTILEDLGGGMRELVFPRLLVDAPLAEFERSLKLAARAIVPLQVERDSGPVLVLMNKKSARMSQEPPSFELAEDCLWRSLQPSVRKSVKPPPPPSPKAASKRPPPPVKKRASKAPARSDEPVLEIPRVAKVLDFGDFDAATTEPKPKRTTRRPPRR
jgi:hypothetical protein